MHSFPDGPCVACAERLLWRYAAFREEQRPCHAPSAIALRHCRCCGVKETARQETAPPRILFAASLSLLLGLPCICPLTLKKRWPMPMLCPDAYLILLDSPNSVDLDALSAVLEDSLACLALFAWRDVFMFFYDAVRARLAMITENPLLHARLRERIIALSKSQAALETHFAEELSYLFYHFDINTHISPCTEIKQEYPLIAEDKVAIERFFFALIERCLLPLYLKTHQTAEKEAVSYAIQEIIRGSGMSAKRLRREFTKENAAVLAIFLESKYVITGEVRHLSTLPLAAHARDVDEWRRNLVRVLAEEHQSELAFFTAKCSIVYSYKKEVAMALIRSIVLAGVLSQKTRVFETELCYIRREVLGEARLIEHARELVSVLDALFDLSLSKVLTADQRDMLQAWLGGVVDVEMAVRCGCHAAAIRWLEGMLQTGVWPEERMSTCLLWGIEALDGLDLIDEMQGYAKRLLIGNQPQNTYKIRAMVMQRSMQWPEAERWYERMLAMAPCEDAARGLLWSLMEQDKYTMVLSRLATDLGMISDPLSADFRAEALLRMGRWEVFDAVERHTPDAFKAFLLKNIFTGENTRRLLCGIPGNVVKKKIVEGLSPDGPQTLFYGSFEQRRLFYHTQITFHSIRGDNGARDSACLRLAALCRESRRYASAMDAVLRVSGAGPAMQIERARLEWACGTRGHAVELLRGVATKEARFLLATWMAESTLYKSGDVLACFEEALEHDRENSALRFHAAEYHRKILEHVNHTPSSKESKDIFLGTLKAYAAVVKTCNGHAPLSLIRMLNLWLGNGAATEMHALKVLECTADTAPERVLVHALSKIVSRLCHDGPVTKILSRMVCRVFEAYPHRTAWCILPLANSLYSPKRARAQRIVDVQSLSVRRLFSAYLQLSKGLVRLAGMTMSSGEGVFHALPELRETPSKILLPMQAMLVPQPIAAHAMDYVPFVSTAVYIERFIEDVEVLVSLQRPKKFVVVASDGNKYAFLCKPKDDLRKDSLFMEFAMDIRELLPAHLRVFSVAPLNEECGLIEWVPNTRSLGSIIEQLSPPVRKARDAPLQLMKRHDGKMPEEVFVAKVLPLCKPVMHRWLLESFATPHEWLSARRRYTTTTAIASIIGYIVGLGDRHTENILFDMATAETIHVDFNCLFDRGATLPIPERVPFRLTRNIVSAMGVSAVEGVFRTTCEKTLSVVKEHREMLVAMLEAFLNDPFVKWDDKRNTAGKYKNGEAQSSLLAIKKRISSVVDGLLPMSVPGHVSELISQATDNGRLCRMYSGWKPYL
eukprot:GHVN01087849.1.p1 GENE.GHVN01087849.1~~GHVN01087849.1.p1  ORF type:complete len:1286 (-),score=105.50 GHVN01087849.1:462-4319(-)